MSERLDRFRELVEGLVARFERDVDRVEWVTKRYPKRMRDEDRRIFEVPALYLQKGPTRLLLDPMGYELPDAEGAVDLYLMPTYDDMACLYFQGGRWVIDYPLPPDSFTTPMSRIEPRSLTAEMMNQVLDSIAAHAVPSV